MTSSRYFLTLKFQQPKDSSKRLLLESEILDFRSGGGVWRMQSFLKIGRIDNDKLSLFLAQSVLDGGDSMSPSATEIGASGSGFTGLG